MATLVTMVTVSFGFFYLHDGVLPWLPTFLSVNLLMTDDLQK